MIILMLNAQHTAEKFQSFRGRWTGEPTLAIIALHTHTYTTFFSQHKITCTGRVIHMIGDFPICPCMLMLFFVHVVQRCGFKICVPDFLVSLTGQTQCKQSAEGARHRLWNRIKFRINAAFIIRRKIGVLPIFFCLPLFLSHWPALQHQIYFFSKKP